MLEKLLQPPPATKFPPLNILRGVNHKEEEEEEKPST